MMETLVIILNLSIEIEQLISTIIEKIDIDSKISLVFFTHTKTSGTKITV